MSLTFNGFGIPGTFLVTPGKWDYQRQQNSLFGVEGATVLVGDRTTRPIEADGWIWDAFSYEGDLEDFLESLAQQEGQVGTLEEDNAVLTREWDNVEFAGFEQSRGPFPPGGNVASWLVIGKLHFIQLSP
jgi:hypothetical protein